MSPPEGHGIDRLRAGTTIGEVLETAISFERTAFEFYDGLRDKVGKPLRELVAELAEEERRHHAQFSALKGHPEVQAIIAQRIATPPSNARFSDYVHLPDLGDHPDDQAVLQYAMGREEAAREQYEGLAEETPEGPLRELFKFLAAEELEHKSELEKRYYELVYSRDGAP